MPDIIRLLPDSVANQIAAGEVVQRPASAVKELIENSIDAGATRIEIIIEDAGKSLIQIVDNGKGMSETDARMALERHATSKIKAASDLESIRSFGFRGEALPSIAAIAQIDIKTRTAEQEIGTHIRVEGSSIISQEPVSTPVGTNIAVRQLFYNVPARRNFLKKDTVELKHIITEIHRAALAYPEIYFSVYNNAKELLRLESQQLPQRMAALWGKKSQERFLPIEQVTDEVTLTGWITKADQVRKTRGEQYFFVNRRFVKSGYLHHAVSSAYSGLIPDGSHPGYVINLEIDPAQIDINVHPTKHEIKFQEERIIYRYLTVAIRHALGRFQGATEFSFETEDALLKSGSALSGGANPRRQEADNLKEWRRAFEGIDQFTIPSAGQSAAEDLFGAPSHGEESPEKISVRSRLDDDSVSSAHGVLSLAQGYLIKSMSTGLLMIDTKYAHERIIYEELQSAAEGSGASAQTLLFPLTLRFSGADRAIVDTQLGMLRGLGFDLEHFGGDSYVLRAVPAGLAESNAEETIRALIDRAEQDLDPESMYDTLYITLARSMATHRSNLTEAEQDHLITRLLSCAEPYARPGGGYTMVTMGIDEIAEKFKL